ncbi:MAG: 2-oxoglutarate ferredoxin oxidoreductase subunit alpha [Bacteroidia bacterium]|nr:MAG: 2-oxoglutarate ferredoxin oxidoreductase subunit alpha [Bacteroidia bacterium]
MIVEGAVQAGCKFFAGYPITPATGIFKGMVDMLPGRGGLALSAPDEISAIAYAIGASLRGLKAMTATSGPGWALMTESVQFALMTETPLVIALVQRLGPSTGGATQGAQGDVLLAEYCTSGGYTIPVLCPATAMECYSLAILAFTWAEVYRTPVVLLTDKEIAMTSERIDDHALCPMTAQDRPTAKAGSAAYAFEFPQEIPGFRPVGGYEKVTVTGSAHDKQGRLQKNSPETVQVLRHLEEKIRWREQDFSVVESDLQAGAETLVVSYGVTSRAALQAVVRARAEGTAVSFLAIKSLFPVPKKAIVKALAGIRTVIVPEENLTGLYRSVLSSLFHGADVRGVNKVGSMITPGEILEAVKEVQ